MSSDRNTDYNHAEAAYKAYCRELQRTRTEAQRASDYFNSLPIEERKKLAPLLEDYRRMGIAEALRQIKDLSAILSKRERQLAEGFDV